MLLVLLWLLRLLCLHTLQKKYQTLYSISFMAERWPDSATASSGLLIGIGLRFVRTFDIKMIIKIANYYVIHALD